MLTRDKEFTTLPKRKFCIHTSVSFELSVGCASNLHRQDFRLDRTAPSSLSIKAKDVDLMIITDNGNGGSTIAHCRTEPAKTRSTKKRRGDPSDLSTHADPPTTEPRNQCVQREEQGEV